MSTLPAELGSLVCGFLSIADLKAARQVNKRWAYISGPFLFEEILTAQPTFQKLEGVSCHETLRFHVNKVVLSYPASAAVTTEGMESQGAIQVLALEARRTCSKVPAV